MFDVDLSKYRVVDLSYEVVPGESDERPFDIALARLADDTYRYDITCTHSHVGTHVEMPWHYYRAGKTVTDYPVTAFMGRCVLLPFSLPPGQLEITPAYVEAEIGGLVRAGDIVLFHNAHNVGLRQGQVDDLEIIPYITPAVAHWLRDRQIKLFGFDIMRLGRTVEETRAVHDVLMSQGVPFVEWLDHLEEIGTREFYFMALPYKVRDLDSAFARAIGIVERA
jgi:arylformamidase